MATDSPGGEAHSREPRPRAGWLARRRARRGRISTGSAIGLVVLIALNLFLVWFVLSSEGSIEDVWKPYEVIELKR
jgi:hypothetical protein